MRGRIGKDLESEEFITYWNATGVFIIPQIKCASSRVIKRPSVSSHIETA